MNEKLLNLLGGKEYLYPKNLEERYPRVLNHIIDLWHSREIDDYFTDLMMNTRDVVRQGFPGEAASEILSLSLVHAKLRSQQQQGSAGVNAQNDAEASKKATIEQQGYAFSPKGFIQSAENGDRNVVALFLSSGVDIDTDDEHGWTPLMLSTFKGKNIEALLNAKS